MTTNEQKSKIDLEYDETLTGVSYKKSRRYSESDRNKIIDFLKETKIKLDYPITYDENEDTFSYMGQEVDKLWDVIETLKLEIHNVMKVQFPNIDKLNRDKLNLINIMSKYDYQWEPLTYPEDNTVKAGKAWLRDATYENIDHEMSIDINNILNMSDNQVHTAILEKDTEFIRWGKKMIESIPMKLSLNIDGCNSTFNVNLSHNDVIDYINLRKLDHNDNDYWEAREKLSGNSLLLYAIEIDLFHELANNGRLSEDENIEFQEKVLKIVYKTFNKNNKLSLKSIRNVDDLISHFNKIDFRFIWDKECEKF